MDVNNEGFFEPLAQKPVAWMSDEIEDCDGDAVHDFSSYQDNHCKNPLYTTPPQPKEPEQEPVALPCCGYTDASAVKWNPYNQVVQCHNCGQVYTTPPQRTEQEQQIETLKRCLFQMQEAAKDLVEQAKSLPPPQRKPLPYEKVVDLWLARFDTNEYDEVFMNFARAIEAAHGIKEKNSA